MMLSHRPASTDGHLVRFVVLIRLVHSSISLWWQTRTRVFPCTCQGLGPARAPGGPPSGTGVNLSRYLCVAPGVPPVTARISPTGDHPDELCTGELWHHGRAHRDTHG